MDHKYQVSTILAGPNFGQIPDQKWDRAGQLAHEPEIPVRALWWQDKVCYDVQVGRVKYGNRVGPLSKPVSCV